MPPKTIIREGRYYNANGYATAIVAVITEDIDWAVYIGGADVELSEEDVLKAVALFGCKLPEHDARHYFPDIKLPYRY